MSAVLEFRELDGEEEDEGDLDDLVWLDIHREMWDDAGDDEPVQITGVVVFSERSQKEEEEDDVEDEEKFPAFFNEELKIDEGEEDVDEDAQQDCDKLDRDEAQPAHIAYVLGRGEDEEQAEATGDEAEDEQDEVAFFEEVPEGREERGQRLRLLLAGNAASGGFGKNRTIYFNTFYWKRKPDLWYNRTHA